MTKKKLDSKLITLDELSKNIELFNKTIYAIDQLRLSAINLEKELRNLKWSA